MVEVEAQLKWSCQTSRVGAAGEEAIAQRVEGKHVTHQDL
jgi:hypothetical protein